MPQIIALWNFEDGTTQGWELLDPDTSLASDGVFQGTYSVRLRKTIWGDWDAYLQVMRILNINIQNSQKPLLIVPVMDRSSFYGWPNERPLEIKIVLLNSSGLEIASFTYLHNHDTSNLFTKTYVCDLTPYKSVLYGIRIDVRNWNNTGYSFTLELRFDMIAIVEADTTYNMSFIALTGEARNISRSLLLEVPSSRYVFTSLASPPWFHVEGSPTDYSVVTYRLIRGNGARIDVTLDSTHSLHRHATHVTDVSEMVIAVESITYQIKVSSITLEFFRCSEVVALVLFSSGYSSITYVIRFDITYTINPHTPTTQVGSVIIIPGQSITRSYEFRMNLRFSYGGVRLRVVNVTDNYNDILSGLVIMNIYTHDTNELVGTATVDPKTGNNVLSDLVLINSDTLYRVVITFSNISVRANVSLRAYIVYEVA